MYKLSILSLFNTFKKWLHNFQDVVNRDIIVDECITKYDI